MALSDAIPGNRRATKVAVKVSFNSAGGVGAGNVPQKIGLVGVGNTGSVYSSDSLLVTNSAIVAQTYGFGSQLHLASIRLFPDSSKDVLKGTEVTIYPLQENSSTSPATSDIEVLTPATSTGAIGGDISGIDIPTVIITKGDTVEIIASNLTDAINSVLNVPVVAVFLAGVVTLTAKYGGESGNDITASLNGGAGTGVTFTIADFESGAGDPVIPGDLGFNNRWETMVVNTLSSLNTDALDVLDSYGQARRDPSVNKPFVCFSGTSEIDLTTLINFGNSRKFDFTNSIVNVPDSPDLPCQIAADSASIIAAIANTDPAVAYIQNKMQTTSGDANLQFDGDEIDLLLKAGITYTTQESNISLMGDVVTLYHPDGEKNPPYRYVINLVKLSQLIYRLTIEFNRPIFDGGWLGAPLIKSGTTSKNPNARSVSSAISAAAAIVEVLGYDAILTDTETTIPLIQGEIDDSNSDRMNLLIPVTLSGTVRIISMNVPFSFFTGA